MDLSDVSYRDLLDNLYEGVYFTDTNRVIKYWNKAAENITGYTAEELVGKQCRDNILMHVDDAGNNLCQTECPLAKAIHDGVLQHAGVHLHHKQGHRVPVQVRITPVRNPQGQIVGAVELFSSDTARTEMAAQISALQKLALLDSLTEIPNRRAIEIQLSAGLQELARYSFPMGLILFDIDDFKKINDTYGHDAGDRVLQMVAKTAKNNMRPFDFIGRWGGDEFVGLIRNVNMPELRDICERLRSLIAQSFFMLENNKINVTIAMGAALAHPDDSQDALLKRADTLMYHSKMGGKNSVTTEKPRSE
ncbi:diguanylate cyclase domain-containing protein [Thermodesulfobacteriota bacterium]